MSEEKKEDVLFEIKFYEDVLKRKGDFLQALMVLGDIYTKEGMHEKGLDIDQRLAKLRPYDSAILYNLACSYSLLGKIDNSFETMKLALSCGYDDFEFLKEDKDLDNLFKDDRFKKYFDEELEKKPLKTKTKNP